MTHHDSRALIARLARDLEGTAFRPSAPAQPRLGAEVELIPVWSTTRHPVPIAGMAPVLDALAARLGWPVDRSARDPAAWHSPCGGRISFEPGGQIEYSSPAVESASRLIGMLQSVVWPLREVAADRGIELLATGLDPSTPLAAAPRQLFGERYDRMEAYFDTIGPAGARMMRQTASLQVCIDTGADPDARWRLLNALAPMLTAIFANSPFQAGQPVCTASARACTWRALDPSRTGVPAGAPAAHAYAAFALDAPDMMRSTEDGAYVSFAQWIARAGFSASAWQTHLSTIFPDVRPRGYFEIRSCDTLPPEWYAAPLALVGGVALHPATARAAAELLGAPSGALLERASVYGLRDATIAQLAPDLVHLALQGCRALGERFMSASDVGTAERYFERYTVRGLAPADDALAAERTVAA